MLRCRTSLNLPNVTMYQPSIGLISLPWIGLISQCIILCATPQFVLSDFTEDWEKCGCSKLLEFLLALNVLMSQCIIGRISFENQ